MKKFIILMLLATFIVSQKDALLSFFNSNFYQSVCDTPISYRIGYVDPQFGISENVLLSDIKESADIWGKLAGKDLLKYDPNGQLTINMVFDKRQALTDQISQYEDTLKNKKNEINPQIEQYQKDVADFDSRKNSLNDAIQKWNSRGGAPPDVYNAILQEQRSLQEEADRLNQESETLNQTTDSFNADVEKLNQTVNDYNQTIASKPEEGMYDGQKNEIYIYFLTDKNELIHTLAHEMGHALSLDHVGTSESIMYPYVSKTLNPSEQDAAELQAVCAKQNILEIYGRRALLNLHNMIF